MQVIIGFVRSFLHVVVFFSSLILSVKIGTYFESLWPLGVWALIVVVSIYWSILKPQPDFTPLEPPNFYRNRFEAKFFPFATFTAWLGVPVSWFLLPRFNSEWANTVSSLSVFAFMGLVLTQIILVTVRKNEAEATREWSVQKRIARAILVTVGVVGFVGLALFVIGYWGRYPGWWIMLPFGWLIGFAVIQGILQIRDFEPYVKPYYFATKRSYVLNGLVGLLGIALWSVVVTLMGIEGLAILNVFLVPISLSLLAVFGITMLLAKRRAKKHLAELE